MKMIKTKSHLICFALSMLGLVACTATEEPTRSGPGSNPNGPLQVTIGAEQTSATRTSLDPDGRTTRWVSGDRIAVWAANPEGTYVLDGETFTLHTFNGTYSSADFAATISPMEPDATYTYYATYPLPTEHTGTQVTFTLPTTQSGAYDATSDIMVSAPVSGGALEAAPDNQTVLSFKHLCHAVRIEIPEGRNLLGRPVKRLEVVFPTEVVGTLGFDAATPEAAPTLSNGSNTVVIDLADDGLNDASGSYAWIFIAPVDLSGDILFRAYDAEGYQAAAIHTTVNKSLEAGHTTPIRLTVPEARPVTYLDFTVAQNNLGEELTQLHINASEPLFATPFSAADGTTLTLDRRPDGTFRAAVYADTHTAEALHNLPLTVDYESANVLLADRALTLPATIADQSTTQVPMTVPYLMEEDFSGITGDFGSNDSGGLINYDAEALDGYGVPGWSISRAHANYHALCLRHYVAWGIDYPACINSAPLSAIKEGKSVTIQVSFNAAAEQNDLSCQIGGYDSASKRYPGTGDPVEIDGGTISIAKNTTYAGYDRLTTDAPSYQYTINATCTTGLRWKSNADLSGFASYYNAYIDNVRVRILN